MDDFLQRVSEKIKNFLNKIFGKKELMIEDGNQNKIQKIQNVNKEKTNEIDKLKQEAKREKTVNEIVQITEENPELLDNLSIKQLKVIDKYYDENLEKINKRLLEFRQTLKS